MTYKLNNARNRPVINLQNISLTCSVNASSVSWTSRLKPSVTVYDKLVCRNKGPLTVSDNQLSVGGKWENVQFSFTPFPSSRSHSHYREIN